jgi:citrate lyase subunit beta/citryl-CoA lyase
VFARNASPETPMTAMLRPRRSLLYMPGSNPRALQKARGLPADGLIFDLEDAIASDAKESARKTVAAALAEGGYGGRELVLRVNALDTPWGHADLAAAAVLPIDAVLLPKAESAEGARLSMSLLDALGAPERLAVWCMLETPLGILYAREIAAASPRLAALVLGTSDLTKDLHALTTRDRLPLSTSLGLALLAARAHGLAVLDGVHLDLSDDEGFAASCRQGRELGFDGKTLIHPRQIAVANATFAPTTEEREWSRRIIAAHAEAATAGKGIVLVDGRLIENLHVENARRIVALAEAIDQSSPQE